jgi:hypothetical protein
MQLYREDFLDDPYVLLCPTDAVGSDEDAAYVYHPQAWGTEDPVVLDPAERHEPNNLLSRLLWPPVRYALFPDGRVVDVMEKSR